MNTSSISPSPSQSHSHCRKPHTAAKKRGNRDGYVPVPPIEGMDLQDWHYKTRSNGYRKRIKDSVESVATYRLLVAPRNTQHTIRPLSRRQVAACHYFAYVSTVDSTRGDNTRKRDDAGAKGADNAPKGSLTY